MVGVFTERELWKVLVCCDFPGESKAFHHLCVNELAAFSALKKEWLGWP